MKIKFRFLLPPVHTTRLACIGTLQSFNLDENLRVIIGGCLYLCVIERFILVKPLFLETFRYDEHTVYHLTIQLETLKSQQLVFHIPPRRKKLLVWSITQNWWTEETGMEYSRRPNKLCIPQIIKHSTSFSTSEELELIRHASLSSADLSKADLRWLRCGMIPRQNMKYERITIPLKGYRPIKSYSYFSLKGVLI